MRTIEFLFLLLCFSFALNGPVRVLKKKTDPPRVEIKKITKAAMLDEPFPCQGEKQAVRLNTKNGDVLGDCDGNGRVDEVCVRPSNPTPWACNQIFIWDFSVPDKVLTSDGQEVDISGTQCERDSECGEALQNLFDSLKKNREHKIRGN
jgi:hypothetical protein